ncbi:MAG: hypothetical protein JXB00_02670 [Bacteroidales bacterium]|nr:hypothetical protein [Bacteroidales bacterium]
MTTTATHDLDMLMACKIVTENFAVNLPELKNANETWTEETVVSLMNRVERAFNYFLGMEANRESALARNKLNHIQAQALRAVVFLKTRIEVIYALDLVRKNQVLDRLGFKAYLKAIYEKDTGMLLELLGNINKNLTEDIRKDLIRNEADRFFIERLSQYAVKLQKANLSRTSLLSARKAITEQAGEIYNELLLEVLDICSEATAYYRDKPAKAKLFDFSFIIKNPLIASVSAQ